MGTVYGGLHPKKKRGEKKNSNSPGKIKKEKMLQDLKQNERQRANLARERRGTSEGHKRH